MSYKIRNGVEIKPLDNQVSQKASLIPKPPFSMLISAQKGSGKTSMIINMLLSKDLLAGVFNHIIWISPTNNLDQKIRALENTKGITSINTKLIKKLKSLKRKIKLFDTNIDTDEEYNTSNIEFREDVDMNELKDLVKYQDSVIETLGKEYANSVLIIYDDLASNKLWKSKEFLRILLNSRHHKISMIISTQCYHLIDKSVRLNNSQLILYELSNIKEILSCYEENNCGLSYKDFLELTRKIWDIPYSFLVVNYQNPKKYRLQNQFKEFIDF